jgi:hypothetical protein
VPTALENVWAAAHADSSARVRPAVTAPAPIEAEFFAKAENEKQTIKDHAQRRANLPFAQLGKGLFD